MSWSIEEYCENSASAALAAAALQIPPSSRNFLEALNLPKFHPFCQQNNHNHILQDTDNDFFVVPGIPSMGTMDQHHHRLEDETILEQLVTLWFMVAPPLLAIAELWIRLLAAIIAPLGCMYLAFLLFSSSSLSSMDKYSGDNDGAGTLRNGRRRRRRRFLGLFCLLTVGSSLMFMTDTYYVLNNGPVIGVVTFLSSVIIVTKICLDCDMPMVSIGVWFLVLLGSHLVWDIQNSSFKFGHPEELIHQNHLREGLYFDNSSNTSNPLIQSIVHHWPEKYRNYSIANGATPWMPSGDSRTGLPFLLNHYPPIEELHRVFMPTLVDEEYVALDIAFPPTHGFNASMPTYLVLHGLNGGSKEEYIRDFTYRRINEGSTVIVMIARGLMDLPVKGWNIFHGARTSDAHAAALSIKKAIGNENILIGVGYSMGGIILNNYVASYGSDCSLDGAISLSGGLDMRNQENFHRAQRLWQPILAESLRNDFFLGKFGKRAHARLSKDEMRRMMRATHITEIDRYAVVPYNGFYDLNHYYTSMSALGDIPQGTNGFLPERNHGKIHNIAIPLVVVHAFDDPLITWRTVSQNEGFMNPEILTKSGSGNLLIVLTKGGGHVGWPTGMLPFQEKWTWMSNIAGSFGVAVVAAKQNKEI